jgi:hypothetical protein
MDGYIKGAVVCYDTNSNTVCDAGEPQAVTTDGGRFALALPDNAVMGQAKLLVNVPVGAIDEDDPTNPIETAYTMRGVVGESAVVSPLTTALAAHMDNGLNRSAAASQVLSDLGMSGVDVEADYISAGNIRVHNVAKVLARLLQTDPPTNSASLRVALPGYATAASQAYSSATAISPEQVASIVTIYGPSAEVRSLAFASGYTALTPEQAAAVGYAFAGRTTEGGAFNWTVANGATFGWGSGELWWSGVASSDNPPNFYWGGPGKEDQAYMESWVNAANDGTIRLSGQSKLKLTVWGNDQLVGAPRFTPVIQLAADGNGCYARAEAAPLTPQAVGVATYEVNLSDFTVVENCGVETSVAQFMAKPIGSIRVRIYKANYYTADGAYYQPNGINLGPISFRP